MSNDTMVTVQGWLGSEPVLRDVGGVPVAGFRVACTPRRFHRGRNEWVEGRTQWYGVSAWRALGEHCQRSLRRGDPVVVYGRLDQRSYSNKNGVEVTVLEIEAVTVGHDLSRGISSFNKTVGSAARRDQRPADPWAVPGVPGGSEERPTETDPWATRTPAAGGSTATEEPAIDATETDEPAA